MPLLCEVWKLKFTEGLLKGHNLHTLRVIATNENATVIYITK